MKDSSKRTFGGLAAVVLLTMTLNSCKRVSQISSPTQFEITELTEIISDNPPKLIEEHTDPTNLITYIFDEFPPSLYTAKSKERLEELKGKWIKYTLIPITEEEEIIRILANLGEGYSESPEDKEELRKDANYLATGMRK